MAAGGILPDIIIIIANGLYSVLESVYMVSCDGQGHFRGRQLIFFFYSVQKDLG